MTEVNVRPDDTWETTRKKGIFRRLTLRRADGDVYLDRWAIAHDRIGGIMLHRMAAPDPGVDLHDHPWWFVTIPLWGGYIEERALTREAPALAAIAERMAPNIHRTRGVVERRDVFRPRAMRLDECHTVTSLVRRSAWSLVIRGPRIRSWGFYLASGYMSEATYDATVRVERRDLWSDQNKAKPW
jgi:hypothetical protein